MIASNDPLDDASIRVVEHDGPAGLIPSGFGAIAHWRQLDVARIANLLHDVFGQQRLPIHDMLRIEEKLKPIHLELLLGFARRALNLG